MTIKVDIKNFTENELACRCGCHRLNYDDNFLVLLQAFRLNYGKALIPTSGCRCVQHNKNVGGVETSLHQCETKKATACDVTGANVKEIFEKAKNFGGFNEVIYYPKKNIVHLGVDSKQTGNYYAIA